MIRYFRLEDDMTIPNRWHLGVATLTDGAEPRLRAGIRVETSEALTIPVTHPGRPLEFCLTSFGAPVATRHLAEAMVAVAGSSLQCIPAIIPGGADMVVVNALNVIRCLDENRSEFVKWTLADHRADLAGHYRQISTLVLNEAEIPVATHVFRIHGSLVELVVSERVKVAMEAVGCLGARFIEVPT